MNIVKRYQYQAALYFARYRIHCNLKHRLPPWLKGYFQSLLPLLQVEHHEVPLLAIDFELTGLKPRYDEIVSIGYQPIQNGQIELAKAGHMLIHTKRTVKQSACIHGIHDRHRQQGMPLAMALSRLFHLAHGHILLAHHSGIEQRFLQSACLQLGISQVFLPMLDTWLPEHRWQLQRAPEGPINGQLSYCRQQYGLPDYPPHQATLDALATAELFLAQTAVKKLTLWDLLRL
ncbi:3'-5' exonuclease [Shewanella sp. NFH-SH190041]|uniref:3'-5' exonuclease n=1 Tax=Shewanella sp. NFH-SH190041 TaxID=2950245 RepID=UPI0021C2710B|nr:3'-5' exonuclease [Shewanella sp. NFH-SH190041]